MTTKTLETSNIRQEGLESPSERMVMTACPSCNSHPPPGAAFCHYCGHSLKAGGMRGFWSSQRLTVVGAAGVALAIVGTALVTFIDIDQSSPSSTSTAPFAPSATATGQPPDLSIMTPREAADRLFNRIMMATEQGNREEALQFVPMALQAYDVLGTLDLDALYHVGRIHETAGEVQETEAIIAKLRAAAPDHLLATLLEHDIAMQRGDTVTVAAAATAFLGSYDAELAQNRQEYSDHKTSLEKFRVEADSKPTGAN